MARKHNEADPRMALRRFDASADHAERSLYDAKDALDRVADARDDKARRKALGDVLESLMDASYSLGMAEAHLLHAGKSDPFKVPRYRQVVEMFTDTWKGAKTGRVANRSPRLPKRGDPPLVVRAYGSELVVQPGNGGQWMAVHGPHRKLGDRQDILEDIEHFQIYGQLPVSSPGTWSNPRARLKHRLMQLHG